MEWTQLDFGKHAGKSLPQVLFIDPDWFFWAFETKVFEPRPGFRSQANLINERARNITPPKDEFKDPVVEYLIHPPTRKFARFDVVPRDRPLHEGGSPALRRDVIDMSLPRRISQYDKLGCKSLVSSLKHYLFGGKSARITRDRAEAFFSDANNFRV